MGHVLVDLTQGRSERPDGQSVSGGGEGDTDDDEEEIGDGKADDQHVRHVLWLAMIDSYDEDDYKVADYPEEGNDTEGYGNEDGDARVEVFL